MGAQPLMNAVGETLDPGSAGMTQQCDALIAQGQHPLVCSKEALAQVLREIGWPKIGNLLGLAAFLALPSVILMLLFAQTRIFFVMARDGLLPAWLATVNAARSAQSWESLMGGSVHAAPVRGRLLRAKEPGHAG